MKSFIAAVLVVIGISVGASMLLETFQRTADRAYSHPSARIDLDPRLGSAPKG